ncbi:PREDICTED: uncharacterized protein LOC108619281 [Drosophila arizonae]|uniref:Uncharacterized protein LOC108619281 n=1 Tax=Drosophila arizonae TaxID=7263 RepID=A0ABM1PVQ1_DROAR|nr:PREDICTED: uncharacterized protein LOC108619281 [Drosophila arizonae]XP_017871287.1 PREDICTED: uncharacterized protein LOC108619281 [Drosophila arizonae]
MEPTLTPYYIGLDRFIKGLAQLENNSIHFPANGSLSKNEYMDNNANMASNGEIPNRLKPNNYEVNMRTDNELLVFEIVDPSEMTQEQLDYVQNCDLFSPDMIPSTSSKRLYERQGTRTMSQVENNWVPPPAPSLPVSEDFNLYTENFPPLPVPKRNGMRKH